ncbi:NAD(P)-dependent oxidoreductase [Granulicatella sp. 19428wC4_WM01]|nr:NAD(P)-dependent oxidoreductase [Granulicatella sp. 19428wC4_WM01]TFU91855.1 NAD(P)-dependent oxidoreductase [Granulicatella sp. WM01]
MFSSLAASNHSTKKREEHDFYATEPKATELLLEQEKFNIKILEPACGQGHISEVLASHGYRVISSDLIDRGYGQVRNFFDFSDWDGDIITNPPYREALKFVKHSLNIIKPQRKVAMFLKIQFLESKERRCFFEKCPPKVIYVSSGRLICARNAEFNKYKSSAVCYAWYIWEKGYIGEPIIRWIN